MTSELVRRLERALGPEGLRDAGVVLDEAGEVVHMPGWLRDLVDAADGLPLPDVPPLVTQELLQLFEVGEPAEPETAVLVRDTRTVRPVGVRGATASESWSMMYTSPVADVVLDVWPDDDGTVDVAGHVMAHRELGKAYRARVEGPVVSSVASDRLGRFRIPGLPAGEYALEIGNGEIELSLVADLSPTPP